MSHREAARESPFLLPKSLMASSSDPIESLDQDTEPPPRNPSMTQQQELEEDPSNNHPQLSPDKTLTPETAPDPQDQQEAEEMDAQDQQLEGSLDEGKNEEEDAETVPLVDSQVGSSSVSRRGVGGGSRRKKGTQKKRAQEKRSREKLKVLVETLKPVPFEPVKTLDFSRHEKLLKTLGLWDFVHLEFDQSIREDLVAQLIAFYNPDGRCSYVNGSRVLVNRADLARALKLPKKKDKLVIPDEDKGVIESEESIKFLEEFVSTWVLLQGDDTWIMPKEVVEWEKSIKEKQWDKLDWAWLLWFMVEKELKAEPPLGNCYYASHMQLLIKTQKEVFLTEESKVEDYDVKELDLEAGNEEGGSGDVKMADGFDDSNEEKRLQEENKIELNLGQEKIPETVAEEEHEGEEQQLMDFEESKKEEQERWLWNETSNVGSHFLSRCSIGNVGAMECDEEKKTEGNEEGGQEEAIEDVEEEEEVEEDSQKHEVGFPPFPNGVTLDGATHENLLLGDASPINFSSGLQIHGNTTGEFLASRDDFHMIQGSSSLFGNGNKREIDHENDISHHSDNAGNKRLRTDEPSWDHKSSDFDICMAQVQHWIGKARMSYEEKERACGESSVHERILLSELQRREEMMQELQRIKFEEQQRKNVEIYKLENELRMMVSVLEGYRKALKETRKAFREHRERCPLREEPVYKDVKGSGGLVLSTSELEKQQLKQEEEEMSRKIVMEGKIKEIENEWIEKFEGHNHDVGLLCGRLLEIESKVKLLRESFSQRKNKISDTPECAAPS